MHIGPLQEYSVNRNDLKFQISIGFTRGLIVSFDVVVVVLCFFDLILVGIRTAIYQNFIPVELQFNRLTTDFFIGLPYGMMLDDNTCPNTCPIILTIDANTYPET